MFAQSAQKGWNRFDGASSVNCGGRLAETKKKGRTIPLCYESSLFSTAWIVDLA